VIGADLREQVRALAADYPDIYACVDPDRVAGQRATPAGDDFGPASDGGRGDSYIVAQQATGTRARGIAQLVGLIRRSGRADSNVMADLLGGDGLVRRVVASLGPGQPTVVTCDASPFMVEAAWASGIPALLQRAEAPVFRTGSVGGVLLAYGTHHIPPDQRQTVIREAMRILAPGGALVVHDFLSGSPMADWFTKVVDAYSITGHDYVHFESGEMESYLRSAGFTDIGNLMMDDSFVMWAPTRDQAELSLGGYLCDMYGLVRLNEEYGTRGAPKRALELATDTFRYEDSRYGSVRSDYDLGRGMWRTRMPRVAHVSFGRKPE